MVCQNRFVNHVGNVQREWFLKLRVILKAHPGLGKWFDVIKPLEVAGQTLLTSQGGGTPKHSVEVLSACDRNQY